MIGQRRLFLLTKLVTTAAITVSCIFTSKHFLKQCHGFRFAQLSLVTISSKKKQIHGGCSSKALVTPEYRRSHRGDDIRVYSFLSDILDNLFGNNKKEMRSDDDTATSYPLLLFEIPVKEMKVGGLRFLLGLLLMGKRNIPEVGSWKVTQANDGVLDVLYTKDETASFSITFLEKKIILERWGTAKQVPPSLQYQLQESILLHSILDELETLSAYGNKQDGRSNTNYNNENSNQSNQSNEKTEEIEDSDRLLTLIEPGDAIQIARSKLPARSEEKKEKS